MSDPESNPATTEIVGREGEQQRYIAYLRQTESPFPPPEMLAAYGRVDEDAPKVILRTYEENARTENERALQPAQLNQAQIELVRESHRNSHRRQVLSQWQGYSLAVFVLLVIWRAIELQFAAGAGILTAGASLTGALFYGISRHRMKRQLEHAEKTREESESERE